MLRALCAANALPLQVADLLYQLKQLGNGDAHDNAYTVARALQARDCLRPREKF